MEKAFASLLSGSVGSNSMRLNTHEYTAEWFGALEQHEAEYSRIHKGQHECI
jgi:hypothetical protein